MEKIGRAICETKHAQICDELEKYKGNWMVVVNGIFTFIVGTLPWTVGFWILTSLVGSAEEHAYVFMALLLSCLPTTIVAHIFFSRLTKKREKKKKEKFFQLHPNYAELMQQAENK